MNIRDMIPICPHGSREDLDFYLVELCDFLSRTVQEKINYTSGYRCEQCNKDAGGSKVSAHIRGKAVDIAPAGANQRYQILSLALLKGVRRVGIARDHVHLDLDASMVQEIIWIE